MTPDEARSILGVPATATTDQLRDAYRQLMRRHHPDLAGPTGAGRATLVIEAYRVLRAVPTDAPADRPSTPARPSPTSGDDHAAESPPTGGDADVVTVASDTAVVFAQLREAAEVLGEMCRVDPDAGLLETIVTWDGWPPSSLLVRVAQRGQDTVAHCTLESLTTQPAPPIRRVVAELHRVMDALAE